MQIPHRPSVFWRRWLQLVTIGVMAFGLALALAPTLARKGFSLLVYASADRIAAFGAQAEAYISLVHAVLGAVLFGWGVALLFVVNGLFSRGAREGWWIVAVSIAAWFIPDTAFSLWFGFWQNAVFNAFFVVLFGLPLAATYRGFHDAHV